MSAEYEGKDPLALAQQAERDLNSHGAKQGYNASDSSPLTLPNAHPIFSILTPSPALESGVDQSVTGKFPSDQVKIGSAASGAGDNREIPVDEGGDLISKPGEKGSGQ